MRRSLLLSLVFLPLCACASVNEAANGPQLAPVGYPAALMPQDQQVISATQPPPEAAGANSLWRVGARAFFADQRAHRVGDILTVQIEIDDSAQTSNTTNANRTTTNNMGLSNFFGLETSLGQFFPSTFDPANLVTTNSGTSTAGAGAVSRSEKVKLTIAAVVTAVNKAEAVMPKRVGASVQARCRPLICVTRKAMHCGFVG